MVTRFREARRAIAGILMLLYAVFAVGGIFYLPRASITETIVILVLMVVAPLLVSAIAPARRDGSSK